MGEEYPRGRSSGRVKLVALDFPAAGEALWSIFDATGIRPEYLLPVLAYESGFRPDIPNGAGAPYYGIGQNGVADIATFAGVDPETYMTWSASQQLATVVKGYFGRIVARYGQLNSGTRVYQAEYLPGTLPSVTSLDGVLSRAPSAYYEDNKSFDHGGKGYITLDDLRMVVAAKAADGYVKSAIAQTYALRPSETPEDPALGTDFGGASAGGFALPPKPVILTAVAILGLGAWATWTLLDLPNPLRKLGFA
jgi:hypothetical protein